ncbi:MAG: isocitrate lyase/phosphoenolpyruvate mutase family protein, partial [Burkholderiales bacterium]
DKPLNVVMSAADPTISLAELAAAGVKRVSVGGALYRMGLAAVMDAARAMREQGSFKWVATTLPGARLTEMLRPFDSR